MEKAREAVPEGWFKWERPRIDFPFYNDDSVPTGHAWLLIGATLFVAVVMLTIHIQAFQSEQTACAGCT